MKIKRFVFVSLMLIVSIFITQPQALAAQKMLSQQEITTSIAQIIKALESDYIFLEKTELLKRALLSQLSLSQFQRPIALIEFTKTLGVLMRNVSGDGLLDVIETHPPLVLGHAPIAQEHGNESNFGFDETTILSGNIGYVKVNYFYENPDAKLAAAQAFEHLAGTHAMIIDLRDAEGDSFSLAQFMISYFVNDKTKLAEVFYEQQHKKLSLWPDENIEQCYFKHQFPLYILTSSFLSGSGEFFAYTLKHLDKAVIIGEPTMGIAYISNNQKINEFISLKMPIAIPIHPVTQTNWQNTGVIPDYDTKAQHSLAVAYQLAQGN